MPAHMTAGLAQEQSALTLSNSAALKYRKVAASTPSSFGASAVSRMLATVELLENILLGLDMRTLLLSQRTSRHLKGVIAGSTKLQQALYFRLDTTTPLDEQQCRHQRGLCELNPLLITEQDLSAVWPLKRRRLSFQHLNVDNLELDTKDTAYTVPAGYPGFATEVKVSSSKSNAGIMRWNLDLNDWKYDIEQREGWRPNRYRPTTWQSGPCWERMYICTTPHPTGWQQLGENQGRRLHTAGVEADEPVTIGELLRSQGSELSVDRALQGPISQQNYWQFEW